MLGIYEIMKRGYTCVSSGNEDGENVSPVGSPFVFWKKQEKRLEKRLDGAKDFARTSHELPKR